MRFHTAIYAFVVLTMSIPSAMAGVVSGTLQSVSTAGKSVFIKTSRGTKTYRVAATASITLDSKRVTLEKLEAGMRITAFTDGAVAKKLIARSLSTRSSKKSVTTPKPSTTARKPRTPQPSPKSPSTSVPMNTVASTAIWPTFRGPKRDNRSIETGLLKSWPESGPPLAWSAEGLGEAYSSVSIADGKVFTMGNRGNSEMIIALSLDSGRELWATKNGSAFHEGAGNGPRGTPAVDGDRVFALGGNGDLSCVNAADGDVRWKQNILQTYGGSNIQWGISESPLIDGELLICSPGGRGATVVALNKNTGREVWRSMVPGAPKASYSSPIVAEVGGVRQYIVFTSSGVVGVNGKNGQPMWGDDGSSNGTANCSTPLFVNDSVFSASSYGTGAALLRLRSSGGRTAATRSYQTKDMKNHHGGMVIDNGFVYGTNDGILTCLELASGRVRWRERASKGSVVYADGHIVFRSERGPVSLFEASPAGYREKGKFNQPGRSNKPSWSHPVIADGKLFLRDMDRLFVFNIKAP